SAWQLDEQSGEYFLHLFSKKQPDLNWENPKLREEVYNMMTWWLDKGIDGFRMDVINMISKVPGLPSAPAQAGRKYVSGGEYFMNGPLVHEYLQDMNREVLSKYDIMTVGETPGVDPEQAELYVREDRQELNMLFQFELMDIGNVNGKWDYEQWKLTDLKRIMSKWQYGLQGKGWNSLYMNNHDQPRMVSRFGNDTTYREVSAKLLATMLHTMQGTPYIYQGEEIGMVNVHFDTIDEYKDIETLNMWQEKVVDGGADAEKMLSVIHAKGRDNARTPMQWDASEHAGFTTGTPWIRVNPRYTEINVQQALADANSVFYYYQKLIRLRREHLIMVYGDFKEYFPENEQLYVYTRRLGDEQLLVVLNFFEQEAAISLPDDVTFASKELLISNYEVDAVEDIQEIELRPYEARVYLLK
ncbi:MAG: alpha-amylase family glycosyl hydrolase, partial [Tumebacillaceae bacterium]